MHTFVKEIVATIIALLHKRQVHEPAPFDPEIVHMTLGNRFATFFRFLVTCYLSLVTSSNIHYVIITPMKPEKNPLAGVLLTLPSWLEKQMLAGRQIVIPDPEERMRWVIELSRRNVEHASGGPFAAAVFDAGSGAGCWAPASTASSR